MTTAHPERDLAQAVAALAAFGMTVPVGLDAGEEYAWLWDEEIPRLRGNSDTDLDLDALERAVTIWWNAYLDAHPRVERARQYRALGNELIRLAAVVQHHNLDGADENRERGRIVDELAELRGALQR